jgi:hypothetical protein
MSAKLPAGSAPVDGNVFADAHRQLLADPTIQFDLPAFEAPQQPRLDWIGGMMPVLQVLFWVAVAALVLFILYLIVSRVTGRKWGWRRRARDDEAAAEASWRPEAGEARELLGEADALAAAGRYSEAAHLILFRSIEDIDDKRPDLVRPALTSRDICALEQIPGRPRSAFARIAMMVERSLFGGRPLVSADWSDCRAAYEEFAFAEGWRG